MRTLLPFILLGVVACGDKKPAKAPDTTDTLGAGFGLGGARSPATPPRIAPMRWPSDHATAPVGKRSKDTGAVMPVSSSSIRSPGDF